MPLVYCLTNKTSGKKYVGWTAKLLQERWRAHCKRARSGVVTKLYSAIRAHGEDDWQLDILEDNLDDVVARQREIFWIAKLDTFNVGYNLTLGGDGVVLRGEANPFYGKRHDPVMLERVRVQLSEMLSGENNPQYGLCGELSPNWGSKRTAESRAKIANALRGKPKSEEAKRKMREAAQRSKEKRSASQKLRRQRERELRENSH